MSRRTLTLVLALTTVAVMLMVFSYAPLKRCWYGYLNTYATEHYINQVIAFNARKDLNLPDDAVLFYGDSLVQGLSVTGASASAVNYGVGNAGAWDVVSQLQRHTNISKARVVVLAFGINDINRGSSEKVLPAYLRALEIIPNSVPVIISLLMPVNEADLGRLGISKTIDSVNQELVRLCSGASRVNCLHAGSLLTDSHNQLAAHFHIGDGLHLNAAGNAIWLDALRAAVYDAIEKTERGGAHATNQ